MVWGLREAKWHFFPWRKGGIRVKLPVHASHSKAKFLWRKITDYQIVIIASAWLSGAVLIINVVCTTWAAKRGGTRTTTGILYHGNCGTTKSLSFWIHLIINILSTVIVGASNYSMQCLSSPTRIEIDRAHSKGKWLHIGVPNWENLRRLSVQRAGLWILLASSTVPLQLFYNSAVFSELSTHQYDAFLLSSTFLSGALPNSTGFEGSLREYQKNGQLTNNITSRECMQIYTASTIPEHSDVLIITSYENWSNPLLFHAAMSSKLVSSRHGIPSMNDWACENSTCITGQLCPDKPSLYDQHPGCLERPKMNCKLEESIPKNDSTTWFLNGYPIQYCLARPMAAQCKLRFSFVIMIIVIGCNLIKTICLAFVASKGSSQPLLTIGDAIESFLATPDPTTRASCTPGRTEFEDTALWGRISPGTWRPQRWLKAVSGGRWLVWYLLWVS